MLLVEPVEPFTLSSASQLRLGPLRELEVMKSVRELQLRAAFLVPQTLARVLRDRLEQEEAPMLALPYEALVNEPSEHVELGVADGLGCLEIEASGEDGEASEKRLLVVFEQVVAPLDRCQQRLLAGGAISAPPTNRRNRSSSRLASARGERTGSRAAASSSASGRPSTRRQISTTGHATSWLNVNPACAAPARSRKKATASVSAIVSRSSSGSGSSSGGTSYRCSGESRSGTRLV